MVEIEAMILFHSIIREKNIPKIQMSHIIVHSMTLLEMYLSDLIKSILIKSKTNRTVIKHIVDSNRNWYSYFKAIRKLSPIHWRNHITPKLFKELSINFEGLRKIRNDLVHRNCFVDNYQVVKDSVTMISRLLPVIAGLHNEFLLRNVEDVLVNR